MTDLRKAIELIGKRQAALGSNAPVCLKPSDRERILIGQTGEGIYSLYDGGHTVTLEPGSGVDTVIVEESNSVYHYQWNASDGRIVSSSVLSPGKDFGTPVKPQMIGMHARWIESAYHMCGQTLEGVARDPSAIARSSPYEEGLG